MDKRKTPSGVKTGPSVETVPEGDTRLRRMCPDCGYIEYHNPKVIVGAVCTWQSQVLLCRRAIAPRINFWTIPAGFMELNETAAQGAAREVWEEACARVNVHELIGIYEIPAISQVHMLYRAEMLSQDFDVGEESHEVQLFDWDQLPWDEMAFPSIVWALEKFKAGGGPWMHIDTREAPHAPLKG